MFDLLNSSFTSFFAYLNSITHNNMFAVGIILGALTFILKNYPLKILIYIVSRFFITILFTDGSVHDRSEILNQILRKHKESKFSKFSRKFIFLNFGNSLKERIITGIGFHFLFIDGCLLILKVHQQEVDSGILRNLQVITPFWNRNKIEKIFSSLSPDDLNLPLISKLGQYGVTNLSRLPSFYKDQKQIVDDHIYSKIDTVVDRFLNDDEFYAKNGLPVKEVFFLHGPPGTGKSSLVRHFSSKYNVDVLIVDPKSFEELQSNLRSENITSKIFILMEEIDSSSFLCKNSETKTGYSNFINTLDGLIPLHNVCVFMTSNFKDKIIDSVYRIGRVTQDIFVDYPSKETIYSFLDLPVDSPKRAIIEELEENDIPIALLPRLALEDTLEGFKRVLIERKNYLPQTTRVEEDDDQ